MLECKPRSTLLLVIVVLSCMEFLSGQEDGAVSVKWGVPDITATVGRLIRIHIPNDAFSGKVVFYTVQCSGGSALPAWLEFDPKYNVLQGIPTPNDTNQIDLEITAHGPTGQASVSSTIFVRDVPSHTSSVPLRFKASGPEFVRCKDKESETVATMILDTNLEALSVKARLSLLQKFISHMELHEDMIKMLPVGHSPMHDNSALVSGTGDCLTPRTSGLSISWPVGCGQVKEGHFPVLQKLDDDSGNGIMAKVLGYSVIEWRVSNSHFQAPTRKRRQIQPTVTPAVTPIIPTKTETRPEKTDDADGKMTHQVVITQSPTFIHPTSTQPMMIKTDEPVIIPPVIVDEKDKPSKVMATEITTKAMPVSKTKEIPTIKPTTTSKSSEPTDVPFVVDGCTLGQKPEVKNPIQKLVYHVGEIINYEIPDDTFEDCEVGGTRGLQLMFFRETTDNIEPKFFLQFDSNKQRIIGMPAEANIGRHRFTLVGTKKSNQIIANTELVIQIRGVKNKKHINHELSVTVDYDYDAFMENVTTRVHLANQVASVYGDIDARYLTVTKVARGSVIYGWANSSLASRDCPAEEITDMVLKLVNEDGSLNKNAVEKLKPFALLGANAEPAGSCEGNTNFPVVKHVLITTSPKPMDVETTTLEKPISKLDEDDKTVVSKSTSKIGTTTPHGTRSTDKEDDIWITTVIPAVVIVVILLIALLIACILYRKKRKGKMNVEEQNTFINKGAPVIFPDELEDKPSDVNKPLLLEGSLSPPPEYHRGTSESPDRYVTNNLRNNKNNLASSPADDSITEMPEKPYEPPPPVTTSSNNKQPRTTHPQQPYSQQPHILP